MELHISDGHKLLSFVPFHIIQNSYAIKLEKQIQCPFIDL